jgi:hypothetical protein
MEWIDPQTRRVPVTFVFFFSAFVVLNLYSNLQTAILPGAEDEAGAADYKVSAHKRSLLNGLPK